MRDLRTSWWVTFCIAGWLAGVAFFLAAIIVPINLLASHYDRIACQQFATNANRETKFVRYNFWQWECLTPSPDGKWIPTSALTQIEGDIGVK